MAGKPGVRRTQQLVDVGSVSRDTGCWAAGRCLNCPWRLCLREELPGPEQARVRAAVTLLRGYLASMDAAL